MLEWALGYYKHLPDSARESRARIDSIWFHDLFLAQLIEQGEINSQLPVPTVSLLIPQALCKSHDLNRQALARLA